MGQPGNGTILVTGGAGYIGSQCCKLLAAQGHAPVCYDRLVGGRRDFVRFGPLVEGDIRDREGLDSAFRAHRPDRVMHFAALIEVEESGREPLAYYDVNVGGTIAVLEACRRHGVHQFVFSSTAAVYGDPATEVVPLDAPTLPINPYGRAKLVAEQIVADCARASGFGATILRYFNAAGADPDGDLGMRFDGASHLVPRLLAAAANGSGFEIYGDDYPTPDGTCVRDYIHVWDVATAHIAALDRPPAAGEARIYNLGVGRGYSVREVAASVEAVTRRPLGARIRPRRPGDAAALVAGDTGRVRAALGWQPRYGDIADIVAHGWRWFAADRRTGPPAGP